MSKKMKIQKREPMIMVKKKPKFKFTKVKLKRLFSQEIEFNPKDKITLSYERNVGPSTDINSKFLGDEKSPGWVCSKNHTTGTNTSSQIVETNKAISDIFLGGVYKIKDLVQGNPRTLPYARKPLTVMVSSHRFQTTYVKVDNPFKHEINAAVAKIIRSKDMPDTADTYSESRQFDSFSSLLTGFSGSGHFLGFGGSHDIQFESKRKTHKFYLEVVQSYYTLSLSNDVNEPEDFFHLKEDDPNVDDAISKEAINPNWVYVDSVGYGRMLFVIFESDETYEGMDLDLEQYADYWVTGLELKEEVRKRVEKKNTSLKIIKIGGSAIFNDGLGGNDPKAVKKLIDNYFKEKNVEVPISYSLCTLDNQSIGTNMYVDYESRKCYPKPTKYRVVWEYVNCDVNDDGGDNEQVNARVRIRALDKDGKNILDEDKLNQALLHLIKAGGDWNSLFWTFMKGNSENPLYLEQGKIRFINKSITFPTVENRPIAKIVLTADITEYDFGPNDNFGRDDVPLKIKNIDPDKIYVLTCTHEESVITFGFRILPEYD